MTALLAAAAVVVDHTAVAGAGDSAAAADHAAAADLAAAEAPALAGMGCVALTALVVVVQVKIRKDSQVTLDWVAAEVAVSVTRVTAERAEWEMVEPPNVQRVQIDSQHPIAISSTVSWGCRLTKGCTT